MLQAPSDALQSTLPARSVLVQPDQAVTLSCTALSGVVKGEVPLERSLPLSGTSTLLFPEDKALTATRPLEASLPCEPSAWQLPLAEALYDDSEDEDGHAAELAQSSRIGVGRRAETLRSALAGSSALEWSGRSEVSELSDLLARSADSLDYSASLGAGPAGAGGRPGRPEALAPSPAASTRSSSSAGGGISPGVMDKGKLEAFAVAVQNTKGLGVDLQSDLLRLLESMPSP
mmetsp:Transcript_53430/g.155788  ORF Transcript_53430/g.155788 Transcript_53430/m.155788 type:complete len:232 (-) Transcript_53430:87-782(-)